MVEPSAKRARFPKTADMVKEGLDAADRAAVRTLVALGVSKRTQAELEADAASAKTTIGSCAAFSTEDLKMLIMLAEAAETSLKQTGGRRRHQRGGGLTDAIKYVLNSLCGVVQRGLAFTAAQTEDAVRQFGVALETMTDAAAARRVNAVLRKLITGATTTAAIYDLAQGPDGYIGSIVVALASAMYAAAPNALTALQALPGAAGTAAAAAGGVGATYVGVAAVTYASSLIMHGIRDGVRAIRDAPNPTDPAQIHEVLRQALAFVSNGRIRLGAYVALRGAPRAAEAGGAAGGADLHPGENLDGRRVNVLLLEDGALEAVAAGAAGVVQEEEGANAEEALGISAAELAALRARNAARFGPGGGAAAAGQGGRRRHSTRKHRSRRRRHTRKH